MAHSETYIRRAACVAEAMRELRTTFALSAGQKALIQEKLEALWDAGLERGVEIADPDWERDLIG